MQEIIMIIFQLCSCQFNKIAISYLVERSLIIIYYQPSYLYVIQFWNQLINILIQTSISILSFICLTINQTCLDYKQVNCFEEKNYMFHQSNIAGKSKNMIPHGFKSVIKQQLTNLFTKTHK
ncbi:hypothetical protein pb186bvf_020314 [Paramecium bursaria]